jgi:hypothetical protein
LGEIFVQGRGGGSTGSKAVDFGSGSVSAVRPFAEGSIARVESGLPLFVIASTSEDFITIDEGDGFAQMLAPGFSVPFVEEFFGFLPAGSLSKDWEDFYSSLPMDHVGMSDSKLLKEAFALPWEVDVPASPSCKDRKVSSSGVEINQVVRPSAPAKSLIWHRFFGPRAVSPPPVVLKEVLPVLKGKDPTMEIGSCSVPTTSVPVIPLMISPSLPEDKQGVQSAVATVLPSSQVCSSSDGTAVTKPIPINSFVSLSQLWYTRRVKEKVAKQLNKNKELIAEAVGVFPVVGEDQVADTLNLAPVLGLSWGGEDKKLRDLVEATVPKVKGMRELKNLDYDISPVKGKRRRGWLGSKNAFSFPLEVH